MNKERINYELKGRRKVNKHLELIGEYFESLEDYLEVVTEVSEESAVIKDLIEFGSAEILERISNFLDIKITGEIGNEIKEYCGNRNMKGFREVLSKDYEILLRKMKRGER